ncbi:unnamed protein product [Nezara viridula]|uniref:Uncharacterized protein n=1 Tax=Nezara viridula TaxID=85310 RepID=A0A9P0E6W8_NEZVI|nr:unnamed protein product [Nezara viridula]
MPHGEPDAVKTLSREYLNMKRDFIGLDYKTYLDRNVNVQKLYLKRSRRNLRNVMYVFDSVDVLQNVFYCKDLGTCPVHYYRPKYFPSKRDDDDERLRQEVMYFRKKGSAAKKRSMSNMFL